MSVDLRSNTIFERVSLVIVADALIKLEHERTKDRIRKFMFDGVEGVFLWRTTPWVRITICGVAFGIPGVALFFFRNTPATVTGSVLVALSVTLIAWYLYCRKTTIRIARLGSFNDITGIFRPSKVRRFRGRLVTGIRDAQRAAIARSAETASSTPMPPEQPPLAETPRDFIE